MDPTVHIVVEDVNKRQRFQDSVQENIWHPLEQLTGYIVVRSSVALLLDEVVLEFQGTSDVLTKALDKVDNSPVATGKYMFLSQLHEPLHFERVERCARPISAYVALYNFLIPRWVLVQSCDVPEQCLSLPPSLDCRRDWTGTKEARGFSQPHIAYHLHLKVVLRNQEICPQIIHKAWEEIKLLPYTDDYPPTDIRDFPGEFVQHMTNSFKTSMFSSMSHNMMMFMEEPVALHLGKVPCATNTAILVEVEIASGVLDAAHIDQLISRLHRFRFEVKMELRVKTFHSTTPFPRLPSRSPLTAKGQLRLNDQFLKLDTIKTKPVFWNAIPSASSQSNYSNAGRSSVPSPPSQLPIPPRKCSTTIRAPIVLPSTLLPTFCSVVVARQYSLITRVKAVGVSIRPFRLEVPLQIIYPAPRSAGHADGPSAMLQRMSEERCSRRF